jgi:hypothetical protein
MRQSAFTFKKMPGNQFCQRLNQTQGHSVAGKIKSIWKSYDITGTASVVLWSEFLAANLQVRGSIADATKFSS